MRSKICHKCGTENANDALFCENCGTHLLSRETTDNSGKTNRQYNDFLITPIIIFSVIVLIAGIAITAIVINNSKNKIDVSSSMAPTKITELSTTNDIAATTDNNSKKDITESLVNNATTTELFAESTSTLENQLGFNYQASNIIDNNISTCWAEGVDGNGIGEKIIITGNQIFNLNKITINNGYCKNETLYYENNRAKTLKFTFDNDESIIIDLQDGYSSYKNEFEFNNIETYKVTVEIIDVYQGSKWNDTCISDIIFN